VTGKPVKSLVSRPFFVTFRLLIQHNLRGAGREK